VVFRARFALLRRADTLTPEALDRLIPVFHAHPRLAAAWLALQTLHGAYLAENKHQALGAIMEFCDLAGPGAIPEFDGIVHALSVWGDEIVVFHHPRAGGSATNGSRAPTTSCKSCAESRTASPTPPTSPPEPSSPAAPCHHPDHGERGPI